jgi:tryptophan-rich sensory protein
MQDPDQWISVMSSPQSFVAQPFEPKPILFPATWVPLKFLQAIAVAKAAASSTPSGGKPDPVQTIMRRFLIQWALADEWHRVFIVEKRVGLAIGVVLCYLIGRCSLGEYIPMMNTQFFQSTARN